MFQTSKQNQLTKVISETCQFLSKWFPREHHLEGGEGWVGGVGGSMAGWGRAGKCMMAGRSCGRGGKCGVIQFKQATLGLHQRTSARDRQPDILHRRAARNECNLGPLLTPTYTVMTLGSALTQSGINISTSLVSMESRPQLKDKAHYILKFILISAPVT